MKCRKFRVCNDAPAAHRLDHSIVDFLSFGERRVPGHAIAASIFDTGRNVHDLSFCGREGGCAKLLGHFDEAVQRRGRAAHDGEDIGDVTKRRDRKAALKFLRKSMKRYGNPEVVVTDKLRSYGAAMRVIGNAPRQETGRWLNNRAENSHLPFLRRERAMLRFRRMRSLQKFATIHSSVHNHFNQERHLYSRLNFKANRTAALTEWRSLGTA